MNNGIGTVPSIPGRIVYEELYSIGIGGRVDDERRPKAPAHGVDDGIGKALGVKEEALGRGKGDRRAEAEARAVVGDRFGKAVDRRGDDRDAAGCRLEGNEAERLPNRRDEEEVDRVVPGRDGLLSPVPDHGRPYGETIG